jgi:hypothetical protein
VKRTVRLWAVFVRGKIINVYEDETLARCRADLERYMTYEGRNKKALMAHVKSVKVYPGEFAYDDGRKK